MALLDPAPSRPGGPGTAARLGLVLLALFSAGVNETFAQAAAAREYQLKAVFLLNFAQFVDWPAPAFADAESPLVIGVLGDNPFDFHLEAAVRGEAAHGRPIVVNRYRRVEEVAVCHVLFISRSETSRLEQILAVLKGRPVLTVGEADAFARSGGMIRFVTDNNRIRLSINVAAARTAELTISSKLLRPAEIVAP
jgi:hypothetical protein